MLCGLPSPLCVPFHIDFNCAIFKCFFILRFVLWLMKKISCMWLMMMEFCICKRIWVFVERICIKYWVELTLVFYKCGSRNAQKLREACHIKLWGNNISYHSSSIAHILWCGPHHGPNKSLFWNSGFMTVLYCILCKIFFRCEQLVIAPVPPDTLNCLDKIFIVL